MCSEYGLKIDHLILGVFHPTRDNYEVIDVDLWPQTMEELVEHEKERSDDEENRKRQRCV